MSLLRSAATIGFYTLISRVLGFIRDICTATFIGANAMTDAFFVAFKLPNLMRRLFAEGAFNAAFVPLYAGTLAADGKPAAQKMAAESMAVLFYSLVGITILAEIFMPELMTVLAPGFDKDPEKLALTITLTRITFPYIIFISLVSLLGGVLNSFGRFAAVAACPILLNLCLIFSTVAYREVFPTPAHALSFGVFAAGVLQFAWLVFFAHRADVLPAFQLPQLTAQVKKLLVLIAPAALGAGVAQVNLMIDMILASNIPEGVSYLYYADRINEFPLAIIGIGVGTALLPMLSKQLREKAYEKAYHTQNRAIELVMLLSLPSAVALMVIAQPITVTLFEHGQFTAIASAAVYPAIIAFGAGLPAFVLVKVLAPGFFANQDTKTPFQIATGCVLLNLILNLLLIGPMAHVGLALATSIASWANVLAMIVILRRRKLLKGDELLRFRLPRMFFASCLMGVALTIAYAFIAPLFSGGMAIKTVALCILIAIGLVSYSAAILMLKIITPTQFKAMLKLPRGTKATPPDAV